LKLTLKEKLERSFRLTYDLVEHLDETYLKLDLPGLPSSQIAGQLWCVVGARESYIKAIKIVSPTAVCLLLSAPVVYFGAKAGLRHELDARVDQHIFGTRQVF
jgi:hypothetical protein